MNTNDLDTLPPTEWLENLLTRDFSEFEPEEGDAPEALAQKAQKKEDVLKFFDLYVDKMLPSCAGTKMWHAGIRHFECVSQSKLPDNKPRVTYTTEAMCAVLYANSRDKWIAIRAWKKLNPGKGKDHKPPQWKKSAPEENTEFQSLYTDPNGGQNKYGGWKKAGRKLFKRYALMNMAAREQNAELCAQVETACVARLYEQNKELHVNPPSKKRKAKEISSDSDNDADEPIGFG